MPLIMQINWTEYQKKEKQQHFTFISTEAANNIYWMNRNSHENCKLICLHKKRFAIWIVYTVYYTVWQYSRVLLSSGGDNGKSAPSVHNSVCVCAVRDIQDLTMSCIFWQPRKNWNFKYSERFFRSHFVVVILSLPG